MPSTKSSSDPASLWGGETRGGETVVYKVGGSLLDLPDLAECLQRLLEGLPRHRPLLIVGGGEAADLVRQWDRRFSLGQESAHWLALQAMGLNEVLVSRLLPSAVQVVSRNEARQAWDERRLPVLSALSFARSEEAAGGLSLPHTWDATSDTVAAWIAQCWPADRLVLLKSTSLPDDNHPSVHDVENLAKAGFVDAAFPRFAPEIRWAWVNLRAESFSIRHVQPVEPRATTGHRVNGAST